MRATGGCGKSSINGSSASRSHLRTSICPATRLKNRLMGCWQGQSRCTGGNPEIADDVEPTSIINACSFNSWEELADYVVYLDDNRELARPFFEPVWPLRIDLDKTRDAMVDLFERADDRRLPGRILRAGRPWVIDAARVRTIVRRSTTTSNT